jgi:hypothetical protein
VDPSEPSAGRAQPPTDGAADAQGSASIERLQLDGLQTALRDALTGPRHRGQPFVVWSDQDSEILLLVDRLQVRTVQRTVVVAVDTESAEFGPAPLIVRFVVGMPDDPAPLVAATDEGALGHPAVAARWGGLFRDVVWAAIVRLSVASAERKDMRPAAILVNSDRLGFVARPHVSLRDAALEHAASLRGPAAPGGQAHRADGGGPA